MNAGKSGAIGDALARMGVPRDGVTLVHSAFRGFARDGYVLGNVLDTLASYFASGTLLVPTMSWRHVRPEKPFFDELETPCNTGALAEMFRTRFATHRSLHPTHSCAGIGRSAASVLDGHHLDETPCSDRSPFGRLVAADGWVVMFGVTIDCCTQLHHAEETVAPELYLRPLDQAVTYTCQRRDGQKIPVRLRHHLSLPRDYYQFQDMLAANGQFAVTALGSQVIRAFRARALHELACKTLRRRPDAIIAKANQRFRRM